MRQRFVTVDPLQDLADPLQWNPYLYANNTPITASDPSGLRLCVDSCGSTADRQAQVTIRAKTRSNAPIGPVPSTTKAAARSQYTLAYEYALARNDLRNEYYSQANSIALMCGYDCPAQLRANDAWFAAGQQVLEGVYNQLGLIPGDEQAISGRYQGQTDASRANMSTLIWSTSSIFAGLGALTRAGRLITTSRTTTATKGVDIVGAKFAQKSFGESFSKGGLFAGRTIDDVAAALRSGAMSPEDIPINVVVRAGNTLITNTRSAQALTRAGVPRGSWNVINRTGDPLYEHLLSEQLSRNGLTSKGTDL